MPKSKDRKEFDKKKRRKSFYKQFRGKDKRKQVHHKRHLATSGDNSNSNLVYLFAWLHTLYHALFNRGETDQVPFRGKNPSLEIQCDDVADGCIKKINEELDKQFIIKTMKDKEQ